MGCVLGSFAFDCVVEDIYEGAQTLVPEAVVRALTDDLNTAVPPQETVQEQLRVCGQVFTSVRSEAKRVAGLAVNMDKTVVLLPLGPDGHSAPRHSAAPEGLPRRAQGRRHGHEGGRRACGHGRLCTQLRG